MRAKYSVTKFLGLFLVIALVSSFLLACAQPVPEAPAPTAPIVPTAPIAPTPTAPAPTSTQTPSTTPLPISPVVKFEMDAGSPPAVGWKWAVGEVTTWANEVIEGPSKHDLTWVFFMLQGSMELSSDNKTKVINQGETIVIPAGKEHTHRYLPMNRALVIQLRPADPPPGRLHGGVQVFLSEKPLEVKAEGRYKLRWQEITLSPGERLAEVRSLGPNLGYGVRGVLTISIADGGSVPTGAGSTFSLPTNGNYVVSNKGATPVYFILIDMHE